MGTLWRWREVVTEAKQRRFKLQGALYRLTHAALVSAYVTWQSEVLELKIQKTKLKRALMRMNNAALTKCLLTWRSFTATRF